MQLQMKFSPENLRFHEQVDLELILINSILNILVASLIKEIDLHLKVHKFYDRIMKTYTVVNKEIITPEVTNVKKVILNIYIYIYIYIYTYQ